MQKLKFNFLVIFFVCFILFSSGVNSYAIDNFQKVKDFEALYNFISENSPLIWINERENNINWLENKEKYKNMIKSTKNNIEYYDTLNQILADFNNGHTHVVSPSYYDYLKEVLDKKPWKNILYNSKVEKSYKKWEELLSQDKNKISNKIEKDRNVATTILSKDKIAYLKIKSFRKSFLKHDQKKILNFFNKIKGYPYLIIDIRDNGGGTDLYWKNNLVAPLIDKPVMSDFYLTYRSGNYVNNYINQLVGPGEVFLRVGRKDLNKRFTLPKEINSYKFMDPLKMPYLVFPDNKVDFKGSIILLIDNGVYSASETFAAFAKATGWATLIGGKTGGAGIGFTPQLFQLPESNLLIRTQSTIGINDKGKINEENATTPHINVKNRKQILDKTISLIKEDNLPKIKTNKYNYFYKFFRDYQGGYGYPTKISYEDYQGSIVKEVEIKGVINTDKSLIKSIIFLQKDKEFRKEDLLMSQKLLQDLNSHVGTTFEVIPLSNNEVKVVLFMEEGHGFALTPNLLTQRLIEDITEKQISYKHYNIGGKLINGKIVYGFTNSKRELSLSYPWPYINKGLGNLNLGTFISTSVINDNINNDLKYKYDYQYINISHKSYLDPNKKLRASYSYLKEDLLHLQSDTEIVLKDRNFHDISLAYIQENNILRGGTLIDHANTSQNYPYLDYNYTSKRSLNKNWSLELQLEAGIKDNQTPYNHLYHPGSYDQMLAYSFGELTGNSQIHTRTELKRKLDNNFVFSLIGEGIYLNYKNGDTNINSNFWNMGLSLEYNIPIGITLRSAYGVSLSEKDKERFYLGVVTNF